MKALTQAFIGTETDDTKRDMGAAKSATEPVDSITDREDRPSITINRSYVFWDIRKAGVCKEVHLATIY
ncbi:MAG: hypothetical protein AMXMBFR16_12640 [Candidatus Uhrbacteria bacterium]